MRVTTSFGVVTIYPVNKLKTMSNYKKGYIVRIKKGLYIWAEQLGYIALRLLKRIDSNACVYT